MSQLSAITLANSIAVPQEFKVRLKQGLTVLWATSDAAYSALQCKLSAKIRPEKGKMPRKVTVKLEVPNELVGTDGAKSTEVATLFIDVVAPDNFPVAKIADLRVLASNVLLEAQIVDMIDNGGFAY